MTSHLIRIERLSQTELCAARLDGDVFELGGGYMPADAVDAPALRAATLREVFGRDLVAVGMSAAWVHGATDSEPIVHVAQPLNAHRDPRREPGLRVRDRPAAPGDAIGVDDIAVLTRACTLADLALAAAAVRDDRPRRLSAHSAGPSLHQAIATLASDRSTLGDALAWLDAHLTPHKRDALRLLNSLGVDAAAAPEAERPRQRTTPR
ncbi:hypothetical protein [Microbacterium halotolerans]|uniref:hypothetical protein n=1 Tax=Microbacterium halotolerans TaxID=246613 RepID=UPI000E6ABCDC|nr:hypothetical protein [Microbacterium halotolerans]